MNYSFDFCSFLSLLHLSYLENESEIKSDQVKFLRIISKSIYTIIINPTSKGSTITMTACVLK